MPIAPTGTYKQLTMFFLFQPTFHLKCQDTFTNTEQILLPTVLNVTDIITRAHYPRQGVLSPLYPVLSNIASPQLYWKISPQNQHIDLKSLIVLFCAPHTSNSLSALASLQPIQK